MAFRVRGRVLALKALRKKRVSRKAAKGAKSRKIRLVFVGCPSLLS